MFDIKNREKLFGHHGLILLRVTFIVVFSIFIQTYSNPISPYSTPLISEVQITDSTHWSIELDLSRGGYAGKNANCQFNAQCSTSSMKLRFTSKPTSYAIKVLYDSIGIAVINRESITGIPKDQIVAINIHKDTIYLIDDTSNLFVGGWKVPIDTIIPQKSLIVNGPSQTKWAPCPSIGKPNPIKNEYYFSAPPLYTTNFISEVKAEDSVNWQIELDNSMIQGWRNNLLRLGSKCTTNVLKLRFGSKPGLFSTQIAFDEQGIAVVTQQSITGASSKITLNMLHDTIVFVDSTSCDCEFAWKLPIDSINPLKSFIACSRQWVSRSSIGIKNDYKNVYHLKFIDSLNNPISFVNVSESHWEGGQGGGPVIDYSDTSDEKGNLFITLPLCKQYYNLYCEVKGMCAGGKQINYIDTVDTIINTIKLTCIGTATIESGKKNDLSPYTLTAINGPNHSVSFVFTLQRPSNQADIRVNTLEGRLVKNIPIRLNNRIGTFSISWNLTKRQQKRAAKGIYLCTLFVDEKPSATTKVIF